MGMKKRFILSLFYNKVKHTGEKSVSLQLSRGFPHLSGIPSVMVE